MMNTLTTLARYLLYFIIGTPVFVLAVIGMAWTDPGRNSNPLIQRTPIVVPTVDLPFEVYYGDEIPLDEYPLIIEGTGARVSDVIWLPDGFWKFTVAGKRVITVQYTTIHGNCGDIGEQAIGILFLEWYDDIGKSETLLETHNNCQMYLEISTSDNWTLVVEPA